MLFKAIFSTFCYYELLVLLLKLALLELFPEVTPLMIDDPLALLLLVPIEDLILSTLGA
jgi:hypothetical protein